MCSVRSCPVHTLIIFRVCSCACMLENVCCYDTQDADDVSALSGEVKQSLRSALSVLGVNHEGNVHAGEERSTFVLGLDAEDLREVASYHYSTHCSTSGQEKSAVYTNNYSL